MPAIFNKEQEEAITHKEGPLMVLAGPGSGKTLVITYRVKWLIDLPFILLHMTDCVNSLSVMLLLSALSVLLFIIYPNVLIASVCM